MTRPDLAALRADSTVLPYADLPAVAQAALAFHLSVDREEWARCPGLLDAGDLLRIAADDPAGRRYEARRRAAGAQVLASLGFYAGHHVREPFGWRPAVRVADLMAALLRDPDNASFRGDAGEFHAWYAGATPMPRYDGADPWPVILDDPGSRTTLRDGRHRLHEYHRLGLATCPALFFP